MLGKLLDQFCFGLRILLGVLMGALFIPVAMQVLSRYTGIIPSFLWTEELATFLFIWIVMIGSIVAVWDGTHFDVRITRDFKSPLSVLMQNGVVHLAIMIFGALFLFYGIEYAEFGGKQRSVMMRANLMITHISVPIAGGLWLLLSGYRLSQEISVFLGHKNANA
ncbi:TRAP transporter small permease [Sulfitobacter aestuariivivens]|uniref:TRAP transporter small permease protein n=1 Tax=Sulfitobacter aestuariivivens TaxID=2766981 RepID=A0A927HHA3_9RHOB|nr:TRAP transporter small permease subunit [Sulfitobacter aestuariivivens]MBD3666264.1 TRAP transporter small permease [Sulfitobacter aestuariivivens]